LGLAVGLLFIVPAASDTNHSRVILPNIVLWAWKHLESQESIDSQKVTVAFLARSIEISLIA
jgi:hypothetical protein